MIYYDTINLFSYSSIHNLNIVSLYYNNHHNTTNLFPYQSNHIYNLNFTKPKKKNKENQQVRRNRNKKVLKAYTKID